MVVTDVLAEALKMGTVVDWSDPVRPTLRKVPGDLAVRLRDEREALREVLRRAVVFRQQAQAFIQRGGGIPLLAFPGVAWTGWGTCLSCGVGVQIERARCDVCRLAVEVAIQALR